MGQSNNPPEQFSASGIPESEIREELTRILTSEPFVRSRRISDFLKYVVEESLQGRSERIKAFSIARAVFGRDESFDPQRDTIVRVEAGRLRRRLTVYYAEAGRENPVHIGIPVGHYIPEFLRTTETTEKGSRTRSAVLLVLAVFAIVIAGWYTLQRSGGGSATTPIEVTASHPYTRPFIAVLPLSTPPGNDEDKRLAAGLVESLITKLTKLSGLSVMAHASMLEFARNEVSIDLLRKNFGVTHALRGSLEHERGRMHVNLQLVEAGTMTTIWAESLTIDRFEFKAAQNLLASQVTEALNVEMTPSEQTDFLRHHSDNVEALALYRQAWILLIPPNDLTRILTARQLFQRSSELDPNFAGGLAGEGYSFAITVLFLEANQPGDALATALDLANKAIEKDPNMGMGYVTRAFTLALSEQADEGLNDALRAVQLSPGDAFVQFTYGMCLAISGSPRKAIEPLQKALKLDPAEPRTPYLNVQGIALVIDGDYQTAIDKFEINKARGGPAGPHIDLFRVVALSKTGKEKEAREIVEELNRSFPDFPSTGWLEKWMGQGEQLEESTEVLSSLGLKSIVEL